MLRWRLLLGTLIVAALVGLLWLDHGAAVPGVWLLPLLVFFTVACSAEFLGLAQGAGLRPLRWVVHGGNLLVVIGSWLPLAMGSGGRAAGGFSAEAWPLFGLAAAILAAFVGEMARYQKPGRAMADLACAAFGLVYVGVLLGFAVQLRLLWGIPALASLILVVKMADTGAYTVGRWAGRHRLAPVLSPGKTVEGVLGGLAFACAASCAALALLVSDSTHYGPPLFLWARWALFGLVVGAAGMVGDLAESLMKRDAGCKDSSRWLPGFGGVLDILDSILVAAPVAWVLWALGLVG